MKHEWKVYYSGNFWGHQKGERPGTEVAVDCSFFWGGEKWRIPVVYLCGKGLVVDLFTEVPVEKLRAFLDRWRLSDEDIQIRSDEELESSEAENPLSRIIYLKATLNGRELSTDHSCSFGWNPCLLEENPEVFHEPADRDVVLHYGLDLSTGWIFIRAAFPWDTKRRPKKIRNLRLSLEEQRTFIAGPHLFTGGTEDGNTVTITHPVTGVRHLLTILEDTPQELNIPDAFDHRYEWPSHFRQIQYTLFPELSDQEFSLRDCAPCDKPRELSSSEADTAAIAVIQGADAPQDVSSEIIGGADGPIAMFLAPAGKSVQPHVACSSLHFQPVTRVEWRSSFHMKNKGGVEVTVIDEKSIFCP